MADFIFAVLLYGGMEMCMLKKRSGYMKGIDLGGWLSQCDHTRQNYDTFIEERDFKIIKDMGFDHVRVPVDYDLVEKKDGTYSEEGFLYIEQAINWARKNGLKMVLDLHKTYGFSFDAGEKESGFFSYDEKGAAYREKFFKLWEEFARRFSGDNEMLCFELLNEITDREFMPLWIDTLKECIGRIRQYSKDIDILIGGYWNNSVDAVPELPVIDDEHIVYNFHCYEPLTFTHQGAYWVDEKLVPRDARPSFADCGFTAATFRSRFEKAVKVAEERSVGLYCGEYGVIDIATPEDTLLWYRAINEAFTEYGIGRALWTYRGKDFGFTDERLDGVRKELLHYI